MERTEHLDAIGQLLEGGDGTATNDYKAQHFPDQTWPNVADAITMIVNKLQNSFPLEYVVLGALLLNKLLLFL